MLTVYSKENCPFCVKTKHLLETEGIKFTEVKIDADSSAKEFIISEGHRTVPQIYKDGKLLVEGGYMGLAKQSDDFFQQLRG